jgi:hypothetical protein
MTEHTERKSLLDHLKDSQAYLAILYIAFIAIGMLFEYQRYRVYGINIFMFADIFDFLVAPLRDYNAVLYIVISMLLIYMFLKADGALLKYKPHYYDRSTFGMASRNWFPLFRSLSYVLLCIFYLYVSSLILAKRTKHTLLTKKDENITFRTNDDQVFSGYVIGRAKDNLIIYKDHHVTILPLNGIKEMSRPSEAAEPK